MLTGPAQVIKIDQKLGTVALDTNVYDVFVFVLAHVLASLVANLSGKILLTLLKPQK